MSVIVSCPKCQKKLKVEDNVLGKNIKCPGCASVFATRAPAGGAAPPPAKTAPAAPKKAPPPPADDDDEDEAPRKPAKAAPRADLDDDEDDDRPAKKAAAKKSRDDDDDEADRPAKKSSAKKSRADDEDEEDDRPAKKGKKKGGAGKVLAIVGVIVFLLCGGCGGVGAYIYYKAKEGVEGFAGALTDAAEKMKTAPEFQRLTDKQGPGHPGGDTKAAGGGKPDGGGKPAGGKPGEKAKMATDQELAEAMIKDPAKAGTTFGPLLQLRGKVTRVTKAPDGKVSEVIYEPQVQDPMTRQTQTFLINCQLANAMPADLVPVGKGVVTVRGYLAGGALASATLSDCVLVFGP